MTTSFVIYTANGSQTQFGCPFPYLDTADVAVTVDGDEVAFAFASPTVVQLALAPLAGQQVRVARRTPVQDPAVAFSDHALLAADDLNRAFNQLRFRQQELDEFRVPDGTNSVVFLGSLGTPEALPLSSILGQLGLDVRDGGIRTAASSGGDMASGGTRDGTSDTLIEGGLR